MRYIDASPFGRSVRIRCFICRDPVYDAKPAYRAAQTLSNFLLGYRFKERQPLTADDYVLVFHSNGNSRFAAWTTSWLKHTVTIPVRPGTYRILSYTGETNSLKPATHSGLVVNLTNAPQYITLKSPRRATTG